MKYKLAIFDLDGTILDTLDDLCDSINYCLNYFSMPLRTIEEIRTFVGNGIFNLVKKAIPEDTSIETIDKFYDLFIKYYQSHCNIKTKPYTGIIQVIKELKEKGIKLAILSNKADEAVKKLNDFYFENLFDYTLGDKEGIERKPSVEGINIILNKFNVEKNNVIYIGDSEVDYTTASNSNLDLLMVSYGFRNEQTLRDLGVKTIVSRPIDILDFILE